MGHSALLALADGSLFYGQAVGVDGEAVGEVVFNTSITGYQEILTDPSYCRQIITFTQPQIGNVGVNSEDAESTRVYAAGLIIKQVSQRPSNWRSEQSFSDYLVMNNVIAIAGIDTRRLTRLIRDKGAQNGCIFAGERLDEDYALELARGFPGLQGMDLVKEVTTSQGYHWKEGGWSPGAGCGQPDTARQRQVVAYDFGVKRNILRILYGLGCELEVVPATTSANEALSRAPDGVFLSNGPGDPEPCAYAISAIKDIIAAGIPTFGICLGHQLLGLACGAETVKMKFGHHGGNHPVKDLATGRVMITSQNHGFTVAEESIPETLSVTHRSLFDGTIQGIQHKQQPAFGFQGHPEASPGPHDIKPLFDHFLRLIGANK